MNQPSWIGHVLGGRYHLEALLGQGGMSSVYRGSDSNLRRAVAIKLIHTHLTNDPEFIRRFETEAAAVAKLRHPSIIQVFDFDRDQGTYYMVLELVSGESADRRVRRLANERARIPATEAAQITATIAEAIEYAHQMGLIHRDIKPANIMLTDRGQAVLMDFGVAKILGGTQHTATGMVIGTAYYISPELVRGRPPSAQSDIYALGATLFEMLAGQPPFSGDSAMSVMMKHVSEPVPDLRQIAPETPEYLVAVVERAMAKDPQKRFQTAGAMAAAILSGLANPNRAVAPERRPPARPQRAGEGAATLVDDLPAGLADGPPPERAWEERRPPPERAWEERSPAPARAEPARQPFPIGWLLGAAGLALVCLALGVVGGVLAVWRYQQMAQASPTAAATTAPSTALSTTAVQATATLPPTDPAATDDVVPTEAAAPTDTLEPLPTATASVDGGAPPGMVLVRAGRFQMGTDNRGLDERPAHPVTVNAFFLDLTEVTNSAYAACVNDGGCTPPVNPGSFTRPVYFDDPAFANFPVTSVRWDQALDYCRWNGDKRLPTEAEWEFAATGGDNREFPWGNTFDLLFLPANEPDTTEVGLFPSGASPFGALDMAGNAVEWVQDFYDPLYYAEAPPDNPAGPIDGTEHVARGGAFGNPDSSAYTTTRRYHLPESATDVDVGFRCAQSP
jgi:formylglycine-generating enzyme required for sulfatase activity